MKNASRWVLGVLPMAALLLAGCVHAARDTTGFAVADTLTVEAPFQETWQATKDVLQDHKLDIFTRDKRGVFVAYSEMKRRKLVPRRAKYTVKLESVSEGATRLSIEMMQQVFGVTLATYYGWHDRNTEDTGEASAILEAIAQQAGGHQSL